MALEFIPFNFRFMMYYLYDNQILKVDSDLSLSIPEAQLLTADQSSFFEANKADYEKGILSVDEIMNCKKVEVITITPTPKEQREAAYAMEPLIEWDGKNMSCDTARGRIVAYQLRGESDKEAALTALYLAACAEVQAKYPDIGA